MGPYGPQGGYAYAHYPVAAPPPDGAAPQGAARAAPPQLPGAAVLAEAARGGRGSNVFFKTRMCNKFRQGSCPYSTKCTYGERMRGGARAARGRMALQPSARPRGTAS
jgi:hypothetical protein